MDKYAGVCKDCGLPYEEFGIDITFPKDQWRLISEENDGLLCAQCIADRAGKIKAIAIRAVIDFGESQPSTPQRAEDFQQDFKELNVYFNNLYHHGTKQTKDAGHLWIAFSDKFRAFEKKVQAMESYRNQPKEDVFKESAIDLLDLLSIGPPQQPAKLDNL